MVAPSAVSVDGQSRRLPQCWGHRGASARYPENTLASFEAAIRDGAEGIESDVHVSIDDVVVMFHDPDLSRTTDSSGFIRQRNWHGEDGMVYVRTKKEPRQGIPTFGDIIELLMKPENQHVLFNVDVKVQNDPARLFPLLHKTVSSYEGWEEKLAPRLVLGLWHPRFIKYAKESMPYATRSFLGSSLSTARRFFWNDVDVMSVAFSSLVGWEGERFRRDCKAAGKKLMVWTVNRPEEMVECSRWDADVIITDVTQTWLEMRKQLGTVLDPSLPQYSQLFLWTTLSYYLPVKKLKEYIGLKYLESAAGPFEVTVAA